MSDTPAVENLKENQTQLDADGTMVGVSRQALDEALAYIALLESCRAWQPIKTAPMDGSTIITAGGRDIALQCWGEDDNGDENWCPRVRGMRQDYWMPAPEVTQ